MSEFKVGDKVRILDVSKILFGGAYWRNGDVVEVAESGRSGIRAEITRGADSHGDDPYFHINKSEFHAIELVEETPKLTKKARIEALERRVEELEKRLAEPTPGNAITSVNDVKFGDKITPIDSSFSYVDEGKNYEVVGVLGENSEYGTSIVILDNYCENFDIHEADFHAFRKVTS